MFHKIQSYLDFLPKNWIKYLPFGCFLIFSLIFPLFVKGSFHRNVMIFIFFYTIMAEGWNILGGYAGQFSVGHVVFFGIGGYTSSLLLVNWGVTPWVGIFLGGTAAAGVSALIGLACFRLREYFFALATIGLAEITRISFNHWKAIGGTRGITLPMKFNFYNFLWQGRLPYYYIFLAFALASVIVVFIIDRSKMGLYLKAIDQDQDAAESFGINIFKYKMIAFAISTFITGIAGSLYAQYIQYIDPPSMFPFMISIEIIIVTLIGGKGTVFGPLLGAIIFIPLSEYPRTYFGGLAKGYDYIITGLLVVLLAIKRPEGLVGFRRG